MSSIPHTSGIYQIRCDGSGKVYIGSAVDLAERWRKHRYSLRKGKHENQYLQNAWNKHGERTFQFEVIELVLEPFLLEREQYWLDKVKPYKRSQGYNISLRAGAPMAGRKHSPETIEKMRQQRGTFRHSTETRKAMSERNKGKRFGRHTPESYRKAAETRKANGHRYEPTPEARQKMSESARNRKRTPISEQGLQNIRAAAWRRNGYTEPPPPKKPFPGFIVTTPDGETLHIKRLSVFCRERGLRAQAMYQVVYGSIKSYKGYTCSRAE